MPDVADLADYVVEEHHRLRGLIAALPVVEPVAVVAATEPVAKKPARPTATTAPAKKAPSRRRVVAASVPAAAKRSRKSATVAARTA